MQCCWDRPLQGYGGYKPRDTARGRAKGGQEETQRQRATPGSPPDPASPQAFPAHSVKGATGEKAESALWPQPSQGLPGFTTCSGALEMAPPPLPLGLPSQGAKLQAGEQQSRGQPGCLDLQWMGSYCLDSVCLTFSSRWVWNSAGEVCSA